MEATRIAPENQDAKGIAATGVIPAEAPQQDPAQANGIPFAALLIPELAPPPVIPVPAELVPAASRSGKEENKIPDEIMAQMGWMAVGLAAAAANAPSIPQASQQAVAAKAPELSTGMQGKVAQGARRQLGLTVQADSFPEGWEKLFTDESTAVLTPGAAKAAPAPATAAAAEAGLQNPEPLKASETADPVLQTGSDNPELLDVIGQVKNQTPEAQPTAGANLGAASTASHSEIPMVRLELQSKGSGDAKSGRSMEKPAEGSGMQTESKLGTAVIQALNSAGQAVHANSVSNVQTPAQVLSRLSDLQQQNVVDHFVRSSLPAFTGGRETLTVELHPPELGRVRVQVESQGDQVKAVVTVQDHEVGEFFQQHSDHLRKSLEEAGIRLGELSVEIRQQFGQETAEKEIREPQKATAAAGPVMAAEVVASGAARQWRAMANARLDMLV